MSDASGAVTGDDPKPKDQPRERYSGPKIEIAKKELIRALKAQGTESTTVLLTAQGTVESAVEAMRHGAYDLDLT